MLKILNIPYKITKNIPIFNSSNLNPIKNKEIIQNIDKIKYEINKILVNGPGILVVKDLVTKNTISEVNKKIDSIAKNQNATKNDHFSNNIRIWNFYEKFCILSPQLFVNYFKNPIFDIVFQSFLGPKYQVSSQINIVKPNSKAQQFHRDYHLGLMTYEEALKFPQNIHTSSKNLSLQCLIAHTNINSINGSTKLIPYSQNKIDGYLDIHSNEEIEKCEEHAVQLNLDKGDVLFFNPAVYHAAGDNQSNKDRIGNILQINSAFSIPMELVNQELIKERLSKILTKLNLHEYELSAINEMVFNNYNYPKNLDTQ